MSRRENRGFPDRAYPDPKGIEALMNIAGVNDLVRTAHCIRVHTDYLQMPAGAAQEATPWDWRSAFGILST